MSGIGLGLQAAQMEQSRNQQAQELAFRQQQAGINNAQEDRRFDAAQAADTRDFDAQQQWRDFQRQQQEQEYAMRRDSLARDLQSRNATAKIFRAVSQPMNPQPMGGTGPVQPHAIEGIDDQTLMNADPSAMRAFAAAKQDHAAIAQQRQMGLAQVMQSRTDGSIKYVSPQQANEWNKLGFYQDGTISPDEMPLSLRQQEEERADSIAQFLAVERDPQTGQLQSNPAVYDNYRRLPLKMLEAAFDQKNRYDQAMDVARLRAQTQQDLARMKGGAGGATFSQRMQTARFNVGQAEKEYRSLTGQVGKMGNLAEPSKAVTKSAEDFSGGTGHWFKFDSTQEGHVRKVAAWEKYQQALAEYDQAATEAYNPQQRGILDGPNGPDATDTAPAQPKDAIDSLLDQLLQAP